MYHLTKEQLLFDLYVAYELAKKGKSKRWYVKNFNKELHKNLLKLRDDLWNRTYKPLPSSCFIINHPKMREVFAAQFRDRIVHHLYFEYTHKTFEKSFINDSYSCIKNRGTLYGIKRMYHYIQSISNNYQKDTYALSLDIKGYFMNIDRAKLYDITLEYVNKKETDFNKENIDIDFIKYLTKEIILLDPTKNCIIKGDKNDWNFLPKSKTLFLTKYGCGLPIGNLTSQLFSNVYLNKLDQYVKRELKCKGYGRYVDDFYLISNDKKFLIDSINKIEIFLQDTLGLELQKGKIHLTNIKYGVSFLGCFLKPNRLYISNEALRRLRVTASSLKNCTNEQHVKLSITSIRGHFSHFSSYNEMIKIIPCENNKI